MLNPTTDMETAIELQKEIQERIKGIGELFIGKKVRIITDFRDQPFGISHVVNLKGRSFIVVSCGFDGGKIWLSLSGLRCAVWLSDIEQVGVALAATEPK